MSTSGINANAIPMATNPQPNTNTGLRRFISHISETIRTGLSYRRPWTELIDRTAFFKPESVSDAAQRIRKNYSYFRTNYLCCIALVLTISLITHPFSLFILLALLSAWIFLYLFRPSDSPLVAFGRTFSDRETLGLLVLATIIVVFLTSIGSILVSALIVGVAVVCMHGAFRAPEDLFLDDQDASSISLLSFLSVPAANVATSMASGRV